MKTIIIKLLNRILILSFLIVLIVNTYNFIKKNPIKVNKEDYNLIDGFPIFKSEKKYIELIRNYPYDIGVTITLHTMKEGETYWSLSYENKISIDTLIGANPFLQNLKTRVGTLIVIPREDGILFAVDDASDVKRMSHLKNNRHKARGDYTQSIFQLFSLDDIRFAFLKNEKPSIVGRGLQKRYNNRRKFQKPIIGYLTSLFGNRRDPFFKHNAFHNGIDIKGEMGKDIYPMADGLVTHAGWISGYGLTVKIFHGNGYTSLYGHCSKIFVEEEEFVKKSTVIGQVGSTGRSTGPHLHFTMYYKNKTVDPFFYVW